MAANASHPAPRSDHPHPDMNRVSGQPQAVPGTASGPPTTAGRAASPSGQTPAGAAAAAAAQAALAGPAPAAKQGPPKYNPPGTSTAPPHTPSADQAQQQGGRPQLQQPPVSPLEALATAGIHHPTSRAAAGPQEPAGAQFPGAPPGAAADPRLSQQGYQQQGSQGRTGPQLPFPDPRPHVQHPGAHPPGPGPTPSQQITAQAARLDPHRAQQQQQQGAGNGPSPLPQPMLQFGSVQHVPNNQSMPNPLHFGIPAGMLPGAKLEPAGQAGNERNASQAQQGIMYQAQNVVQQACFDLLLAHECSLLIRLQRYAPNGPAVVMFALGDLAGLGCNNLAFAQEDAGGSCQHCGNSSFPRCIAQHPFSTPTVYETATPVSNCGWIWQILRCCASGGGSRAGGQDAQQGRQGAAQGPWQPDTVQQQSEFMRQKLAQRQQAQVCSSGHVCCCCYCTPTVHVHIYQENLLTSNMAWALLGIAGVCTVLAATQCINSSLLP